ncbi:hypothetical protein BZZ01_25205 [Nostocales cyanobacterium HT-58-2]|nr:hypothetical protein BZZ01_25205 [Nostocales cyanobacterium HT-58-2]
MTNNKTRQAISMSAEFVLYYESQNSLVFHHPSIESWLYRIFLNLEFEVTPSSKRLLEGLFEDIYVEGDSEDFAQGTFGDVCSVFVTSMHQSTI